MTIKLTCSRLVTGASLPLPSSTSALARVRAAPISVALVAAFVITAAYVGRTASQENGAANNLFTGAGFVVRYADTPEKMAHLRRLPPDKLVTRSRGGKKYYIYADPTICRCAYVGNAAAYQAFQAGNFQVAGNGESRFQQGVDEFNDDYEPSVAGAPSFDDYVFGGLRDD